MAIGSAYAHVPKVVPAKYVGGRPVIAKPPPVPPFLPIGELSAINPPPPPVYPVLPLSSVVPPPKAVFPRPKVELTGKPMPQPPKTPPPEQCLPKAKVASPPISPPPAHLLPDPTSANPQDESEDEREGWLTTAPWRNKRRRY